MSATAQSPDGKAFLETQPSTQDAMKRLSFKQVFAYGSGDAGCNVAFSMAGNFLPLYFVTVLGLQATTVATISLVVLIWDAFADIIAGRVVDATMTRWGKFRPFLLFGSIPLLILTVLLFSIPHTGDQTSTALLAAVIYAVWGTCYSFVNIPYGSLAPAITQVPADRGKLGAARTYGGQIITLLLVLIISPQVKKYAEDAEALQHVLTLIAIGFAVLGFILFMITFFGVKERVVRENPKLTIAQSVKVVTQNKPLAILCLAAVTLLGGMYGMQAVAAFFTAFVLGDATLFIWLTLAGVTANLIVAPMAPMVIRTIGKRKGYLLGCAIAVVGGLILFFLNGIFALALVGYFILSAGMGLNGTLMWALEGDTVEYGEWKNRDRAEGATYSVFSFFRKMSQALGRFLSLWFIGLFGFMSGAGPEVTAHNSSDSVQLGLTLTMAGLPVVMAIISAIIMSFYPITEATFDEMVEELHERHRAEKAAVGVSDAPTVD